jgi:hypothetical protein
MSAEQRTPSETLMAALGECETADNCLIILRHKSDISWHETVNSTSDLLGLLEFVLTCVKGRIMREEMMRNCDCGADDEEAN